MSEQMSEIADFVIVPAGDGHDAFMVTHGPCGERVLFTEVAHLDTLLRIANEHVCRPA